MTIQDGGLTERQWQRLEPPDFSLYDPREAFIPQEQAAAFASMTTDELGRVLPGILGIHGASFAIRFRTGEDRPDANGSLMAKYGGNLQSATSAHPDALIVDVDEVPAPTTKQRVGHYLGQAARWFVTGERIKKLDETPMARVSSLRFPSSL